MATLHVKDVSLTYLSARERLCALDGISFSLAQGEPIALLGPSGCGKSTLLKVIAGLLKPTRGTVLLNDEVLVRPRLKTALILQDYGLLPWKTARDNAALGLKIAGADALDRARHAEAALEQVGLLDMADAYPAELSGGMKQRVAMARALTRDTDLLLMDEPLSALDALTREELQNMLLKIWRRKRYSQALVTHSIEEAVFLGKRIVVMATRPGRIFSIIDNPGMGADDYRNSEAFFARCRELRATLEAAHERD